MLSCHYSCFCTSQWYLRMSLVSKYPAVIQRCQLCFSRMLLVHRLSSQTNSSQAGRHFLWQYYSRHLLLSNFPFLVRLPFWLLTPKTLVPPPFSLELLRSGSDSYCPCTECSWWQQNRLEPSHTVFSKLLCFITVFQNERCNLPTNHK